MENARVCVCVCVSAQGRPSRETDTKIKTRNTLPASRPTKHTFTSK